MKKSLLFVLFIYLVSGLSAQEVIPDKKKRKKIESRISFIEYKYFSGEYEEAIKSSEKLINKLNVTEDFWIEELTQLNTLLAFSQYAYLKFDKADETFKQTLAWVERKPADSAKVQAYIYLADYLQETGDLVKSIAYLNKAQSLLKPEFGKKLKYDLELVKIKTLLKQGDLNASWQLLEDQKNFRLELASSYSVGEENKELVNEKKDFTKRKEVYALYGNLKALCLYEKGAFKEAEDQLKNNLVWIRSNLNKSHRYYRDALKITASIKHHLHQYNDVAALYMEVYSTNTFPEHEQNKISELTKVIISYVEDGQVVKYNNYLRRLEMYAFRSVGGTDLFQLAFDYTEAYKSYLEGDYSSASKRLNRITDKFSFLPPAHPWLYKINQLRADIAFKSNDFKTYRDVLATIAENKKNYSGESSSSYHRAQLSRALFEISYGKDFALAESIMKVSYTQNIKKEIVRESPENIQYLSSYASLFGKTDRYDSARVKAKEATEIAALLFGEKSSEYALGLAEYTEFQVLSSVYKEGFENLEKLNVLLNNSFKGADVQVIEKIHLIAARLYNIKGEFDKSKGLLNKAYKLSRQSLEKQELAEAEASEQLGSLYLLTGNYYKAEKSLLSALSVKEEKIEEGSPLTIIPLLELARLNLLNGNFGSADQYLNKALKITESVFGKESVLYSECEMVRAEYYLAIGDYKKAEQSALNADKICLKKLGKNNLKRAEVLTKMALIKTKLPKWKSADVEKLYEEAGTIIKNALGTENPLYALLVQKQAELYITLGKTVQANQLLDKAEAFWKSKLGQENRYSAEIELLRGNLAYQNNSYEKAEKNYSKSKDLYAGIFSNNHPSYIQASGKLARVYFMQKNTSKSLEVMEEIIPKYLNYIDNYFPSLSFSEKSKFWGSIKEEFEFYNYISLCIYNQKNPGLSQNVYNNIISTKALLLSSNLKIRERILTSNDTILIGLYNNWVSQKEYLTNILSFTKQQLVEQNVDLKHIESEIDYLEKEMSKRSELFNLEANKKSITWKDIKAQLADKEYAVEMIRLRYFNKVFTDSVIYAALIINDKTVDYPEVVILPNGIAMEKKALKLYRNSVIYKTKDQGSYDIYWKSLQSKIPVGSTVYLSSDGVYNQINLEMMVSQEGRYVIDNNEIVLVTNTKDLLNKEEVQVKKGKTKESKKLQGQENPFVLCGNPEFYSGTVKVNEQSIPSLPGAEFEVNKIDNLIASTGKQSIKLTKSLVSEDTIRGMKNPKVFHIATHGYFKEERGYGEEELASNPLLNSGLILFGGGDIINHPENNYVNSKDGILTAYEAMNLNFDNTELVVLSACETGRGEVQVGEGVYGLQRSFLIAGSDAIIMSLFKVNDEVTNKLMHLFYQKWEQTGDKRLAFIEAKREIKKEYSEPIYWGSFVMIEGKPQAHKIIQP